MVSGLIEVLDGCLTLSDQAGPVRSTVLTLATTLLTLPTTPQVQANTKSLLASLHTTKATYHAYKVNTIQWLSPNLNE